MKKLKSLIIPLISTLMLLTSCATTKLAEDEELVKFIKYDYEIKNKKELTEAELREDCDMLKYLVYNTYAGIDEAIENGFDLDSTVENIYQEALKKKSGIGTINSSEFITIIARVFSKELKNSDQHVIIGRNLKDSISLYYSDIYFEKQNNKYFVKKLQMDNNRKNDKVALSDFAALENIKPGTEFTGNEANLYEMLTDEGILYRYGVMTNKKVKTIIISLNNETITVPAHTEKSIPTKDDWTGLQTTDKTMYMSLGNCTQVYGTSNSSSISENYWNEYLKKVSEATIGKEQIIFDLRSNPGGYMQFPAKMLAAAFYNQHTDKEFQENIETLLFNKVGEDCVTLVSPYIMQIDKKLYDKKGNCTENFNKFKPEIQDYYKNYWKHMKTRPIRSHLPQSIYQSSFEELPEPDFKGNIYVLINVHSCSAAEFGTQMTYLFEKFGTKVCLVGENSWGGMKYGGMINSSLPNSGAYLYTGTYLGEAPTASQNPSWHGEGYGWFPDYWATNDTILNTLENLTKDSQLKEVLSELGSKQL